MRSEIYLFRFFESPDSGDKGIDSRILASSVARFLFRDFFPQFRSAIILRHSSKTRLETHLTQTPHQRNSLRSNSAGARDAPTFRQNSPTFKPPSLPHTLTINKFPPARAQGSLRALCVSTIGFSGFSLSGGAHRACGRTWL